MGRAVLEERIDGVTGSLGLLLRLFLLCQPITADDLDEVLGAGASRAILDSGLADATFGELLPTVQLSTVEGLVIAADLQERHVARAADFVLGPFGVTLNLASYVMRRPVESVLDLGCGSGTLGALAASHSARVVATDINARAVAFSQFNAELNGLDHMECRPGSLFEPVDGESFDLILCNPPYVISPGETYVYRDGGTEICRRIVRGAYAHLTDTGYMQMMVEWPQRTGEDWRSEITSWLDDAGCDAWLLRLYAVGAREYADLWLGQEYAGTAPPPEEVDRWMSHLDSLGVDSVGGGVLVLRRARAPSPIRTIREVPPQGPGPLGPSLASWIAAQSILGSMEEPAELMDTPLVPAPHLERTERRTPSGDGWVTRSRELRLREGLRFAAKVDPVAEEIVGLLDGSRTPREALEVFAERHDLSTEPFVLGLPKALAKLLELGLIVPSDSVP